MGGFPSKELAGFVLRAGVREAGCREEAELWHRPCRPRGCFPGWVGGGGGEAGDHQALRPLSVPDPGAWVSESWGLGPSAALRPGSLPGLGKQSPCYPSPGF